MNKTLFYIAVLLIYTFQVRGNPLAIDDTLRPITMVKEAVEISVKDGRSIVQGHYIFHQEKDNWPEEKDTHVSIYIPVLLKSGSTDSRDLEVKVNGKVIKPFHRPPRDDLPLEDIPRFEPEGLPHNWYMDITEYQIPLNGIKSEFSVDILYTQTHFPGNIVGYVPIRPPKIRENAHVVFNSIAGYSLKPFQKRFFFHPSFATLDFFPKDGEIIRVKCIPNG